MGKLGKFQWTHLWANKMHGGASKFGPMMASKFLGCLLQKDFLEFTMIWKKWHGPTFLGQKVPKCWPKLSSLVFHLQGLCHEAGFFVHVFSLHIKGWDSVGIRTATCVPYQILVEPMSQLVQPWKFTGNLKITKLKRTSSSKSPCFGASC